MSGTPSALLPHEERCVECKAIQDKEKLKACFLSFCPYGQQAVADAGAVGDSMFPEEENKKSESEAG